MPLKPPDEPPIQAPQRPTPPIDAPLQPGAPLNMRCPVPPSPFTPDSSRQFYRGNTVPQFRAFSPSPLSGNNNTGVSEETINALISESNSTNSTTTNTTVVGLTTKNASITTPVLNQNQSFTGAVILARVYCLLRLTTSGPARIRVYATTTAQTTDFSRLSSQAPAFGTTQGLIADVTLNTPPFNWLLSPMVMGQNGDEPSSPAGYTTITQLAATSGAITVGFLYVPIEN